MQDGIVASKNTTASNGNEKSPKKVALGIGIGCLAVALIIGAFFIGKSMAKNDNSDNDNVLNSPIIPFQTVAVNIANDSYAGGSVAQFWRNGTNGTWHFFMTGQNTPDCSFFRDFSLPFAGYLCYDGVSNTQTTVGKHFNVL